MKSFIFQGSPDIFDIQGYLEEAADRNAPVTWQVKRYADDMQIGDRVFFWRAAGKQKATNGVVGVGSITSTPKLMEDDEWGRKYWRQNRPAAKEIQAIIEVTQLNLGSRQVVLREWMLDDPILNSLTILKMASGTNYPLTDSQADRLSQLTRNTGIDWTKAESLAALWLYNELYKKQVSRTRDSDTALIALIIGRAVTGVYNKLMNFRSLDPRDERQGLKGINKVDREVWLTYFDPAVQEMDSAMLNSDFEAIWGGANRLTTAKVEENPSREPPEARDDDIGRKRLISQTIRKGQPAFKKRLMYLYGGSCAVTGEAIEAVLDAAHIVDHSQAGINRSENGLLLRSDIHDLFDCGLIRLDPDSLEILADESLKETTYWNYHRKQIRPRIDGSKPSRELIALKNRVTGPGL